MTAARALTLALALFLSQGVHAQLVIAHRGASAYLPEHTLEAYTLAYAQGADYIEPDVVLTRDGVLICAHDLTMERVTDVAQRFPDRARDDGSWYWIDFDLAEIRSLARLDPEAPPRTGHPRAETQQTGGHAAPEWGGRVATLDEMLALVARLNDTLGARAGRTVGVIPEPKDPAFHRDQGRPIEEELLAALARHGYTARPDHAIIQCFDLDSLERFAALGCGGNDGLRLVWLLSDVPSQQQLARAKRICVGLGPSRALLVNEDGWPSPFHITAGAFRFELYPYTFRGDHDTVRDDARHFFDTLRVQGLFTDNPDAGVAARDATAPEL
ncbi:MAG: glycerophosphodiester phosphodiesterase family protein [Phycisphaerales bacterium JB040]